MTVVVPRYVKPLRIVAGIATALIVTMLALVLLLKGFYPVLVPWLVIAVISGRLIFWYEVIHITEQEVRWQRRILLRPSQCSWPLSLFSHIHVVSDSSERSAGLRAC